MPFDLTPDATFWQAFWPGFWANLIVGVVIAALVARIYTKLRRLTLTSRLEFIDGRKAVRFGLAVENTGHASFRRNEIIWHVFVEEGLNIIAGDPGKIGWPELWEERTYAHYKGSVESPVFVDTAKGFLNITLAIPDQPREVRAYLSTAYGRFPRGVSDDQAPDGSSPVSTWPVVLRIGGPTIQWIETSAEWRLGRRFHTHATQLQSRNLEAPAQAS